MDYIYLCVFEAISFVDPKITREEFDSWGLYLPELSNAVTKIALQTGVLIQIKEGDKKKGEE